MSVFVLGSAKASPGVTTTTVALAAAWPHERRILIVEADCDGGVLAARHAVSPEPGLSTLAVASRRSLNENDLAGHTQQLSAGDLDVLMAPPSPDQAWRALELAARPLAALLPRLGSADVLVDVGRIRPDTVVTPLLQCADAVLLITRPRLDQLQHLPPRLRAIRSIARRTGLLLIGEQPYPPAEVAVALDVEVVASLPDDPRAADALAGQGKTASLPRSPLMRGARTCVEALLGWLDATTTHGDDRVGPGATASPARPIPDLEAAQ